MAGLPGPVLEIMSWCLQRHELLGGTDYRLQRLVLTMPSVGRYLTLVKGFRDLGFWVHSKASSESPLSLSSGASSLFLICAVLFKEILEL